MKLCYLVTVAVVAMVLLVPESDAWFWRRRRRSSRSSACRWGCWIDGGIRCGVRCSWRKKREAVQAFPADFESYDLDGNGKVTLDEFSTSLKVDPKDRGTTLGFQVADRNGDGVMDMEEFEAAPFYRRDENEDEYKDKLLGGGYDDDDDQNYEKAGEMPKKADEPQGGTGEEEREAGGENPEEEAAGDN